MKRPPLKTAGAVRPVGARALKSARDTLRPHLAGARVLDLFAGQGRFGTAALEEGAAEVAFVERDRKRLADLRGRLPDDGRCRFFPMDVFAFFKFEASGCDPFDVIFADPPFPSWNPEFGSRLMEALAGVTAPQGILLVKHPSRVIPSLEIFGWKRWRDSRFGESSFSYLTHDEVG